MFISIGGDVVPAETMGEDWISNPPLPKLNENEDFTALMAPSKVKSGPKREVAVAVGEVVVSMSGVRSTSEKRLPRTSEVSVVRGDVWVLDRVDWQDMLAAAAATSCIASSLVSNSYCSYQGKIHKQGLDKTILQYCFQDGPFPDAKNNASLTFELAEEGEVKVFVMGVEKVDIGLGKAISSKRTKSSKAFSA